VEGTSLENWGPKHSRAILKHQVKFFEVKTSLAWRVLYDAILHIETFPMT
jgi:hypothetical protein